MPSWQWTRGESLQDFFALHRTWEWTRGASPRSILYSMINRNICSWLRRDSCVGTKSLSVPLCASLPATKQIKLPRPLQFEVFCFHIASHGALVRHFSGMNTAGWSHGTPNEDFGCITSHAQSTVNTFDLVSDKVVACNQCGCTDTCSVCGV